MAYTMELEEHAAMAYKVSCSLHDEGYPFSVYWIDSKESFCVEGIPIFETTRISLGSDIPNYDLIKSMAITSVERYLESKKDDIIRLLYLYGGYTLEE